jgi:hypothetical protein
MVSQQEPFKEKKIKKLAEAVETSFGHLNSAKEWRREFIAPTLLFKTVMLHFTVQIFTVSSAGG